MSSTFVKERWIVGEMSRRRLGRTVGKFRFRNGLVDVGPCKDKRVGSACLLACRVKGVKSVEIVLREIGRRVFAGPIRLVRGVRNIAACLGGVVGGGKKSPRERALGLVPTGSRGCCFISSGKRC